MGENIVERKERTRRQMSRSLLANAFMGGVPRFRGVNNRWQHFNHGQRRVLKKNKIVTKRERLLWQNALRRSISNRRATGESKPERKEKSGELAFAAR
jgi:hypothetical protein